MEGYNITIVENGLKVVELIMQNDFDVTFFDIKIPGMNGVEALKAIKEFNNRIAVVMMTANAMNNQIEEAEREGVFDRIIKSFEIQKVLDIIKRVELKSLDDKEKVDVSRQRK